MCTLWIGARKSSQHTLILRARIVAAQHEAIEILRQIGLAVEIFDQPPLPRRRQIEPGNEACEQRDVANLDVWRSETVVGGRFETKRKHLGVGRRFVGTSERFDAGLRKFCRTIGAMAEKRTEINIAGRLSRRASSKIVARY